MKDLLNITTLNIDLYTKTLYPKDYLKTEDINSRYKYFKLHYNGEVINLEGLTVRAFMIKPDGKEVYQDLTVEKGLVVLGFSSQALAVEGTLKVEIVISDQATTVELSSFIIEYQVVKSLRTDSAIESSNEYSALQTLLQKVDLVLTSYETLYSTWDERFLALKNLKESELNKLKADKEALLDELYTTKETALDGLKTAKESALNTLYTTKETELNKLKSDKNVELTNLYTARDTDLKNLQAAWDAKFKTKYDNLEVEYAEGLKEVKTIEETKGGSYITFADTVPAPITNVIIKGNTVQNPTNLADIKSTGIQLEDGMFEYKAVVVGENLCPGVELGYINNSTGEFVDSSTTNRMSQIIRVNPGATVTLTKNNALRASNKFYYDRNKKFLRMDTNTSMPFTIPSDAYYLGLSFGNTPEPGEYMLKYVDGVTPYVPYVEKRVKFKLSVQLEKWDTLYFDKEENAWCIEDGSSDYVSDGSKIISISASLQNVNSFELNGLSIDICLGGWSTIESISSKFKCVPFSTISTKDEECFAMTESNGKVNIRINVLKNKASTVEDFKNIITGTLFKYQLKTPQKIVLSRDVQIELNSLLGQTTIYVDSGEISAIINATASKSMGATVKAHEDKINRIDSELQDIQTLKESSDYEYSTDKGYEICRDTKPGVVKDLKIYGKSLVQVYPQLPLNDQNYIYNVGLNGVSKDGDYVTVTGNGTHYIDAQVRFSKNELFKPSTKYTFFIEVVSNNMKGRFDTNVDYLNRSMIATTSGFGIEEGFVGTKIVEATTKDATWFNDNTIENKVILRTQASILNTGSIKYRIWALEGSHDEVVPFFKGIASVGNGNEIEVLSRKEDGNLFIPNLKQGYIGQSTGEFVPGSGNGNVSNDTFIKVSSGSKYFFNFELNVNKLFNIAIFKYDINKKYIGSELVAIKKLSGSYIIPSNIEFVKIRFDKADTSECLISDFNIERLYFGMTDTSYMPVKQDKKPILFKDTDGTWKPVTELRGIDLNSCDTIDTISSRLYKKYEKVTINSSKGFKLVQPSSNVKTAQFWNDGHGVLPKIVKNNKNIICDKLNIAITTTIDEEFFLNGTNAFVISLNKEKASTLEQLDMYLSQNPITFVYEVLEEEYEINSSSVDAYEGDTLVSFNSDIIPVSAEWKLTSYINNMVKENTRRTGNLEDVVAELLTDFTDNESEELLNTNCKSFKAGLGTSNGVSRDYSNTMRKSLLKLNNITGKSIRTPRGNLYNVMLNAVSSSVAPIDVLSQKVTGALKATYTNTGGTLTVTSVDASWRYVQFEVPVEPNSDYMLALDFNEVSGNMWVAISTSSDSSQTGYNITDINFEHMGADNIFNVGDHNKIYIRFYSNVKISEGNKVVSYTNVKLIKAESILETGLPLRSLPHGVADVLENGILRRRVKRFYLKDVADWERIDSNKVNKAFQYKIPDTLNTVDKTKVLLNCNYYDCISDQTMYASDQTAVCIGGTNGQLILSCQIDDPNALKAHLQTVAPHAYVEVEVYEEKQILDINPQLLCRPGDTVYFNNNVALPQITHKVQMTKGAQVDELLDSYSKNKILAKDPKSIVSQEDFYLYCPNTEKFCTRLPNGTIFQSINVSIIIPAQSTTARANFFLPLSFTKYHKPVASIRSNNKVGYTEFICTANERDLSSFTVEVRRINGAHTEDIQVNVSVVAIGI